MDLRHLRYLMAVAECGSVRKAAEKLYVAQPAISRQLQELETELQVRLFERKSSGMVPTRAANALIAVARRTLDNLDEAKQQVRRIADGEEGLIKIGILEAVVWGGSVPKAIARFRSARPRVGLQMVVGWSRELVEMVAAGTIDVALAYVHDPVVDSDIKSPLFRRDHIVLAIPAGALYAREKNLKLRNLRDVPFVWFPRSWGEVYHDKILAACHAGGLVPQVAQQVSGHPSMLSASLLSFVAAGIGATFVVSANIHRGLQTVEFRRIKDLDVSLNLRCIYRTDADQLAMSFVEEFLDGEALENRSPPKKHAVRKLAAVRTKGGRGN